jgi:type I restriction enzyme, R subunit
VRLAIEDALDEGLPGAYSKELFGQKCSSLFEHIYERFTDAAGSMG